MWSVGTKSILFGVHQFLLHPLFVAAAWTRLYGFPLDPRLWLAFFVHDLGYWGKPNMDGPEGERHVEWGAALMRRLCGDEWGNFCLYHSRFYAAKHGQAPSRLCYADKLVLQMSPWYMYLPLALLTGEIWEYTQAHRHPDGKYKNDANPDGYPVPVADIWALPGLPTAAKLLYWHAKAGHDVTRWVRVNEPSGAGRKL